MDAIDRFKSVFPQWASEIVNWTPAGHGPIEVELTNKRFFVFTYVSERTWRLETVRSFRRDESV